MDKKEAKKRIEKLRKLINRYRYEYHVLDTQEVSDAANDALKHELQMLESQFPEFITPDSPTQRVGGVPLKKFKKITHSKRMLSLVDIFNMDELEEWEKRNKKLKKGKYDYYVELKIDGFAIALIYENSILVSAATRGDSYIGEDVTQNVKTIDTIPLHLDEEYSGTVEVRGEIYMSKKEFDRINKERKKSGDPLYANPRNLAAGSIRQLDSKLAASRKLDFFAYELTTDLGQKTKEEEHQMLNKMGFKTVPYNKHVENIKEIRNFFNAWVDKRNKQEYLVDGLVIKVNDNRLRESLGVIGKAPRGMIAYKFPAEQTTTVVKKVEWNVGRTGVLTPLATFEPVSIAGTIVQHATLHNMDEIERLGIKIGDTVIIEKAGDIIPKVVKVMEELRIGDEKEIKLPKKCPICGGAVIKKKEADVAYYCKNPNCFAAEKEGLIHFVSKKGFNIEGLGDKIMEQLMEEGLVKKHSDIFNLTKEELELLERFADKSAENTIKAIDASRTVTLERFLFALGIRHIGEETAIVLAKHFGSIRNIKKASLNDLIDVPEIGEIVAQSIFDYFHDTTKMAHLDELLDEVTIKKLKKAKKTLDGQTIVVTGSLEHFTRDEIKQIIRENGGNVSSSVSRNTDFVLAGDDPGSKFDKANNLGVKVLSEKEFLDMIK